MFHEYMLTDIAQIIGAQSQTSSRELIRGVSINSKTTEPGDLFFALKGERTDGHKFVIEALSKGACAAVVEQVQNSPHQLCVKNTLVSLGELGLWYRSSYRPKTIAITGTNGKTTVKNVIAHLLSAEYKIHYTRKNYNSLIGLPLTLFDLNGEEDYLIVEMGTSNPGEIGRLCEIAKPDIGVITNVGAGHLEGLRSIEGVREEKLSLIRALPVDGYSFIGEGVDEIRRDRSLTISIDMAQDIKLSEQGSFFTYRNKRFHTPLLGMSNVYNCLVGLCVSDYLGGTPENQLSALGSIPIEPGRLEPIRRGSYLIINDTYNANPVSMKAAIDFITSLSRRTICILGDMLELGKKSKELHEEIGRYVGDRCDMVLTFGRHARYYRGKHFTDQVKLLSYLFHHLEGDEVILSKASRGMHFENFVMQLMREL